MLKRKQQEIIFNLIELDEPVSSEFVKELHQLVVKWLFEAWRKSKESGEATCNAPAKPLTDDEFRDGVSGAQVKEKKSFSKNEKIQKEKSEENQS